MFNVFNIRIIKMSWTKTLNLQWLKLSNFVQASPRQTPMIWRWGGINHPPVITIHRWYKPFQKNGWSWSMTLFYHVLPTLNPLRSSNSQSSFPLTPPRPRPNAFTASAAESSPATRARSHSPTSVTSREWGISGINQMWKWKWQSWDQVAIMGIYVGIQTMGLYIYIQIYVDGMLISWAKLDYME